MERLFGGKVFLETWVKVRSGWADDAAVLKRLGYGGRGGAARERMTTRAPREDGAARLRPAQLSVTARRAWSSSLHARPRARRARRARRAPAEVGAARRAARVPAAARLVVRQSASCTRWSRRMGGPLRAAEGPGAHLRLLPERAAAEARCRATIRTRACSAPTRRARRARPRTRTTRRSCAASS